MQSEDIPAECQANQPSDDSCGFLTNLTAGQEIESKPDIGTLRRLPGPSFFLSNAFIGTNTSQRAKGTATEKLLHLIVDQS